MKNVYHTMLEKTELVLRKRICKHMYGIGRGYVSNAFCKHQKDTGHSSFKFMVLKQVKLSQRFGN